MFSKLWYGAVLGWFGRGTVIYAIDGDAFAVFWQFVVILITLWFMYIDSGDKANV